MAKFDATEVFALMKRRGFVPTNQGSFTEEEFLLSVSEQVNTVIVPKLVEANSRVLLRTSDLSVAAGTATYRVPDRAVANGVHSIWFINSSGGIQPLDEIDHDSIPKLGLTTARGSPSWYTFEGPFITLYPTPSSSSGTIRVKYHCRPNRLVKTNTVVAVTSIAGLPASVSVSPALTLTGPFDVIRGKGMYDHLAMDLVGTVTGGTATLTGLPSEIAVGDYICVAHETPIPQLPVEFHLPAACRGVAAIVAAKGDTELAGWLIAEAEAAEKLVLNALTPRNKSEAQDFTNNWW